MKNIIRNLLAFVFAALYLLSFTPAASAVNLPNSAGFYTSSDEKSEFARNMSSLYHAAAENGSILPHDRNEIDRLMEEAAFTAGTEQEALYADLASYGVYLFRPATGSDNSDIILNAPAIYFDAQEYTWTVTCSGYWRTDNWNTTLLPGNIGGCDAFGVGFTNCDKEFTGTVIRSYAILRDQTGKNTNAIANSVQGDVSHGFGFEIQDYSVAGTLTTPRSYVGYYWYGACTFSADFASIGGIATAYYIHTYDTTTITGIHYGIPLRPGGVDILTSDQAASFTAYSSDTRIRPA